MTNEYAIAEVWGAGRAPTLGYIKARSGMAACVAYLRLAGYEARETNDGMIADDDAPRVVAHLITRNVDAVEANSVNALERMLSKAVS